MNIILAGSSGRMGKEIQTILSEGSIPCFDFKKEKDQLSSNVGDKQWVLIDFTSQSYFDEVLKWCVANKVSMVSGTTGLTDKQFEELNTSSKSIPILWAANMSVGVAFLNKVLQQFSPLADTFDFQIEEFHHKHKIDSPSGTALVLKKNLDKSIGRQSPSVLAARGGGIYGIHKVWAMSDQETITIEHTALNRKVFAQGAIRGAEWLKGKEAGLYSIEDTLS